MKYSVEIADYNQYNVAVNITDGKLEAQIGLYRGLEPVAVETMALVDKIVSQDEYNAAMGSLIAGMILCTTFYEQQREMEHNETIDPLEALTTAVNIMAKGKGDLQIGPYTVARDTPSNSLTAAINAVSNFRIQRDHNSLVLAIRQLKLRGATVMDIFYVDDEAWRAEYDEKLDYNLFSQGVDLYLRRESTITRIDDHPGVMEVHSRSEVLVRSDRILNIVSRNQLINFVKDYRSKGKS